MQDKEIRRAAARLNAFALAFVLAVICGFALFLMTVWLLLKGGEHVGLHLQLLGHFFIGYSVTWIGSFIGLLYGALFGWLVGGAIALLYNCFAARNSPGKV